ncbi:MAG: hypothetical protein AB8B79_05435 [Granulosicoccus sp.]
MKLITMVHKLAPVIWISPYAEFTSLLARASEQLPLADNSPWRVIKMVASNKC